MNNLALTGKEFRQGIMFAALLYLLYKFIAVVAGLFLILSVAVIFTLILDPAVSWLEKHKMKRQWSASILALSVIALVGLGSAVIIVKASPEIAQLWKQMPDNINTVYKYVTEYLNEKPKIKDVLPKNLPNINLTQLAGPIIGGASRATVSFAGAITGAFLAFICTVYLLANPQPIIEGILRPMSPLVRKRAQTAGTRIAYSTRAWAVGILIGMVFIFLLTWLALAIIGVKQAFLFAIIAGLLEAVPVVGPILSAIPPLILVLIQAPQKAIWVILAFLGIQQIEGNLLIPLVMSRQLSLHPITVLFSVITMGGLFGIVGVFLATPAAVAAGIIYEEFYLNPRLSESGIVESDAADLV